MLKITRGLVLLIGRFPGLMKFGLDGTIPKEFVRPGVLKSFILSFHSIPVDSDATLAPNLQGLTLGEWRSLLSVFKAPVSQR